MSNETEENTNTETNNLVDMAGQQLNPAEVKQMLQDKEDCKEVIAQAKNFDPKMIVTIGTTDDGRLFVLDSTKDMGHTFYVLEAAKFQLLAQ